MARTANVFARVEPELKEQAESVLDQLGNSNTSCRHVATKEQMDRF